MGRHPRQQGFEALVGLGRAAGLGFGFAQADLQPQAVRVRGLHRREFLQRGGLVAGAQMGIGQAVALGVVQRLARPHLLVFADRLRRRVRTEHAQALARPAEVAGGAAAARPLGLDAQAGRQQRIAGDADAAIRRYVLFQLGRALARLADPGQGDRVGLQVTGDPGAFVALVHPHHRLQGLEELGHRVRVEAAIGQGADADAVGLGLVVAGVVDLPLLQQAQAGHHRGRGRVAGGIAAGLLRGDDRAEGGEQDRQAVALRPLGATQHVLLGDMGNFVGQHAGHLIFAVGGQHQSRVHADVAAEGGEGVDLAVAQHEEGEALLRAVAGRDQALADIAQPAVEQRIVEDVALVA